MTVQDLIDRLKRLPWDALVDVATVTSPEEVVDPNTAYVNPMGQDVVYDTGTHRVLVTRVI